MTRNDICGIGVAHHANIGCEFSFIVISSPIICYAPDFQIRLKGRYGDSIYMW